LPTKVGKPRTAFQSWRACPSASTRALPAGSRNSRPGNLARFPPSWQGCACTCTRVSRAELCSAVRTGKYLSEIQPRQGETGPFGPVGEAVNSGQNRQKQACFRPVCGCLGGQTGSYSCLKEEIGPGPVHLGKTPPGPEKLEFWLPRTCSRQEPGKPSIEGSRSISGGQEHPRRGCSSEALYPVNRHASQQRWQI